MTQLQRVGISLLLVLLIMASCAKPNSFFSKVSKVHVKNFSSLYPQYCSLNSKGNYQANSYLCSFVGDFEGALAYATKHALMQKNANPQVTLSDEDKNAAKSQLEELRMDSVNNTPQKDAMINMLSALVNDTGNMAEVFRDRNSYDAKTYIVEQSQNYHFVLLNEAHHSSQNRMFTMDLLKPLWEQGFRYLALETLGYEDDSLNLRKYPRMKSGYYTKDAVFGNLVREALSLGYKLVPYEAKLDLTSSATLRDKEQAQNIYNATIKNDPIGKVIIHAGYSHISEFPGTNYEPMGFCLRKLVNQPILTVDQQNMTELGSDEVMNPYYLYCLKTFDFKSPVVFLNKLKVPFVEPLNSGGIDVQIFHPRTVLVKGRPSWMVSENYEIFELPEDLLAYEGHLLQAVIEKTDPLTVPADQLIIKAGTSLVLKPGLYSLRIIDCAGNLIGRASLEAR